jgi:hypothetical protein
MHTVRNRVASRPRPPSTHASAKAKTSKSPQSRRKDPAFLLRSPHPPAFPAHLIVPPPRGAVISTMPWPEAPKLKTTTAPKKPRKVAKSRKTAPKGGTRKKPRNAAAKQAHLPPSSAIAVKETPVPMTTIDLLDRALAIKPDTGQPDTAQPHTAKPSLQSPRPGNASLHAGATPLPRSRALAPSRGSGLIDAIGDWLRSVADRLGRWRGNRRSAGSARTASAHAAARQRALLAQFEALEALQEVTGAKDAV